MFGYLLLAKIFLLVTNKSLPIYHIWYLPMIICIYMIYPFVKIIVINKILIKYFLLLSIIFNFIIPTTYTFRHFLIPNYLLKNPYSENLYMMLPLGYICYFVLGYILSNLEIKNKILNIIYISIPFMYVLGSLLAYRYTMMYKKFFEFYVQENSIFILFFSIGIFLLFKNIYNNKYTNNFIYLISTNVFGIFLIHPIFIKIIEKYLMSIFSNINLFINIFIEVFIVFICSLIFTIILRKIPFIKKIL